MHDPGREYQKGTLDSGRKYQKEIPERIRRYEHENGKVIMAGSCGNDIGIVSGFSQGFKDGGMILKIPGNRFNGGLYVGFILFPMWIYFRKVTLWPQLFGLLP